VEIEDVAGRWRIPVRGGGRDGSHGRISKETDGLVREMLRCYLLSRDPLRTLVTVFPGTSSGGTLDLKGPRIRYSTLFDPHLGRQVSYTQFHLIQSLLRSPLIPYSFSSRSFHVGLYLEQVTIGANSDSPWSDSPSFDPPKRNYERLACGGPPPRTPAPANVRRKGIVCSFLFPFFLPRHQNNNEREQKYVCIALTAFSNLVQLNQSHLF
jgi:hypothetical protein